MSMQRNASSKIRARVEKLRGNANVKTEGENSWKSPAVILSLFFVGLYAIGYSFSLGYFDFFNTDIDFFPRGSEVYAAKAIVGILLSIALANEYTLTLLLIFCLVFALAITFLAYLSYGIGQLLRNKKVSLPKPQFDPLIAERVKFAAKVFPGAAVPLLVFYFSLYFLLIALIPVKLGGKVAEKYLSDTEKIICSAERPKLPPRSKSFSHCVAVHYGAANPIYGIPVGSTPNSILLITAQGVEIVFLKEGSRIVREFHVEK